MVNLPRLPEIGFCRIKKSRMHSNFGMFAMVAKKTPPGGGASMGKKPLFLRHYSFDLAAGARGQSFAGPNLISAIRTMT
jgi:hypothetical protein